MAVKRFCDVCGAEIPGGRLAHTAGVSQSVTIITAGFGESLPVQDPHITIGELCSECNHRIGNTIRGAWADLARAVRKEIKILENPLA